MTPAELRSRRRVLGLTQVQLAEALGVSANTVARWERGEVPITRDRMVRVLLEHLADSQVLQEHQQPPQAEAASPVPAVADVLRVMRERGVDQDEAVRLLGGLP